MCMLLQDYAELKTPECVQNCAIKHSQVRGSILHQLTLPTGAVPFAHHLALIQAISMTHDLTINVEISRQKSKV